MVHRQAWAIRRRCTRKLYRYTGKNATNCPLQIHNYSIGGAQWRMPGWIDCKPSPSDPGRWEAFRSERYKNTVLKLIKDNAGTPVIVLAMNNTGYACIPESRIMGPDDTQHINMAVNFLRTHTRTILADGAAMYFLSPKKYWRDLDDPHEWNRNEERYAVRKIAAENIPGFVYVKGVWEDTAKYKELALIGDGHHPTHFGDEIIASKFFRALLEHDGLAVPAWDQEEVDAAKKTLTGNERHCTTTCGGGGSARGGNSLFEGRGRGGSRRRRGRRRRWGLWRPGRSRRGRDGHRQRQRGCGDGAGSNGGGVGGPPGHSDNGDNGGFPGGRHHLRIHRRPGRQRRDYRRRHRRRQDLLGDAAAAARI